MTATITALNTPRFEKLRDVLPGDAGLTLAEKRVLLCQARLLLEHVYVHLHLKQALYGIDPIQRLTLLQYRLENPQDEIVASELAFHRELLGVFRDVRDLHTHYILPQPYRNVTAFLPFLLEQYYENAQAVYLVSKVFSGYQHADFKEGVQILLWNGLPIEDAIRQHGERTAGSNESARFAVGLGSLTIRPLATSLPPDEVLIRITYLNHAGKEKTIELEWLAFTHMPGLPLEDARPLLAKNQAEELHVYSLMGNHLQTGQVNQCRKILYAPDAWRAEQAQDNLQRFRLDNTMLETLYPALIRAKPVVAPDGNTFGYIRIFSFVAPDPELFISEIIRLLHELPDTGVILDVRGNSGGYITMTERLLQLFTSQRIEPEKAQFRATPFTRELCRHNSPSPIAAGKYQCKSYP